jgi:hypothetical protein
MNICYHEFVLNNETGEFYCWICRHSIKKQNLKIVKCECGCELHADINVGVTCPECELQFEAFDAEEVVEFTSKSSEEEIEKFFANIPF